LGLGLSFNSYAIYLKNGKGKALPNQATQITITPLVSILDAVDTKKNSWAPDPESTPIRKFNYNYKGFYVSWPFEHDCAATVIGVNSTKKLSYLLTSAHCVTNKPNTQMDSPGDKRILVGNDWCNMQNKTCTPSTIKPNSNNPNPKFYTVSQILVAKNWFLNNTPQPYKINYTNDYDFAILVVNGILKFQNQPIQPMAIATEKPKNNNLTNTSRLYIAGWGTTLSGQQLEQALPNSTYKMPMAHDRPNYAQVTSLPTKTCQNIINSLTTHGNSVMGTPTTLNPSMTICSGVQAVRANKPQSTACYGDSGGPLFSTATPINQWSSTTQFILVGNVSWSPLLCSPSTCDNPNATAQNSEQDCFDNTQPPQSVPFVYGFPGGVLCGKGYEDTQWVVNAQPNSTLNISAGTLKNSNTLSKALPGLIPSCQTIALPISHSR
jgi:hypothetical protein